MLKNPLLALAGTAILFLACGGGGSSSPSAAAPTVPTAPQGVVATGSDGQVSLSWTTVAGAASYNLYWGTSAGLTMATGTRVTGVTSPHVQASLTDGTPYYFILTALDGAGESAPSALASATPSLLPPASYYATIPIWGGARESLALKPDGTVWTWGLNENGILGLGTGDPTWTGAFSAVDKDVPTQVLGPGGTGFLTSITRVMGCEHFNMALKGDGTLWTWGSNYKGELGIGSTTDSYVPVQVPGLTNVVALGGRGYHGLAVKDDGTVWAWGTGGYGELGDGGTSDSDVPVQVSGVTHPVMVSGGGFFSLALMPAGTVMAWGANDSGQVGNNSNTNALVPVQVQGLSDVVQVAAGWVHAVALKADGTVWVWGSNDWLGYNGATYTSGGGLLGDGTTNNSLVPEQVPGLSNIIEVSAGDSFTAVLRSDGTVFTFGANGVGQCAVGTMYQQQLTPVQVPNLDHVTLVNARDHHCLAMKDDGTVWCWGSGTLGELGNGAILDSAVPVQAVGF